MAVLGVVPGLPFLPFALLSGLMASVGIAIPRRIAKDAAAEAARQAAKDAQAKAEARASIKEQLKAFEIELVLSKELNAALILLARRDGLAHRQDAAQIRPAIRIRRSRDPPRRRHQGARRRPIRSRSTARR